MLRKILVVDDNLINRKVLGEILKSEYEVIEAENGKEALDVLSRTYDSVSAVLLDIIMPVLDGYGVLSAMAADGRYSQIPVIVTTGDSESGAEVKALTLGANDFILKPYNPEIILHRIRNTINLRENAAIVNATRIDALTGLYSRSAFFEAAAEMIAARDAGYYIIACFDIDSFKVINDQYGTVKGDEVLKHIAKTFKGGFEKVGGICCRIMADNFAVLYPRTFTDTDGLAAIRDTAARYDDSMAPITFSIGRYVVDDKSLTVSAMYDRAAIAEASVKKRFDVRIAYYDESMRQRLLREQELTSEMNGALSGGQFEVWFQPQYNHITGALVGAEALVRWRHPKRGLIPPFEFIPVFERNGFIYEMDKFVWEQSCKYLREWRDAGRKPLPVSVNISRYDILRADLIDILTGLVKKYDIPVDLLRLEITESAFSESTTQIVDIVKALIDCGFTVEIDDFGRGYSSLNTLKDVPATILKLDMRFLENSGNSDRGGIILESIVRMAKWLGMSVIAEGVETIEQADYLKSIGCSYVQGYLYAKPMPVADYEALAAKSGKEEKMLTLETVETLDNSAFWDPKSMDTLIFNSYVGGSCIFEYHNREIEIIRANDKYASVLSGGGTLTVGEALKLRWFDYTNEKNEKAIRAVLEHALESDIEVTCEYEMHGLPKSTSEVTYLHSYLRVIARTGDRYLFYCTNENMTSQKIAEEKEKLAAEQLRIIMENVNGGVTAVAVNGDKIDFIFANEKYYTQFGYTKEQYEAEHTDVYELIHPDDVDRIKRIVASDIENRESSVYEYRCFKRDGTLINVRCNAAVTSIAGIGDNILLSVTTDITELAAAERRIYESDEQLRFLNAASHDLLAQSDGNIGITNVLKKLLEYFDGTSAYIIEMNGKTQTADFAFEVCAQGIDSGKEQMKNIPFEKIQHWYETHLGGGFAIVNDIESFPSEYSDIKKLFRKREIKSIFAVPLKQDDNLIGYIAVNNASRNTEHIDKLLALGDYIAATLYKRDLTAKIESDNRMLSNLMNDMPGGFSRSRRNEDGTVSRVYANDEFCRLLGMTYGEAISTMGSDIYDEMHPDDRERVRAAIEAARAGNGIFADNYRLRRKDGTYIMLAVTGRLIKSKDGEQTVNLYYTDISEQMKAERMRVDLIENLPCGAGIYELRDGKFTVRYLNKRYRELVDRKLDKLDEVPVIEAVHPDDRPYLVSALKGAIMSGGCGDCDIRIIRGNGGYRRFRVSGNVEKREGGSIIVYVTYTPVGDNEIAYREMLPIVLDAMMASSTDISFVKDANHIYICCSRAFAEMAGLKSEKEIIGKSDYDIFPKELADKYVEDDDLVIKSGNAVVDNIRVIPNGDNETTHYSNTSKYLLRDADGNVLGVYGTGRDVTENREAFARLKLLTDNFPGSLAMYDISKDGAKILYLSDGMFRITGHSREEYINTANGNALAFVFEEDYPVVFKAAENIIKGISDNAECSVRVHIKGGGYKWLSLRAAVAERHKGHAIVNTVIFDVTAQRELEAELEADRRIQEATSAKDKAALVRSMDDELVSVAVLNVKSGIAKVIRDSAMNENEQLNQPFDFDAVFDKMLTENTTGENLEICRSFFSVAALTARLEAEQITRIMYDLKTRDGRMTRRSAKAFYLDETKEDIIIVRRDITDIYREQMDRQEKLRAAVDAANNANRAKSDFLSRMSHDMRTPMNAILAFSGDEMTESAGVAQLREYLGKIHSSGNYLLGIINDVLDMAKIEQNKLSLHSEPYSLDEFTDTINTVIADSCRVKGIEYTFDCHSRTSGWINVDRIRFNQIFINLLSNAVKFTPRGGRIEFLIEKDIGKKGNILTKRFTVRDNGVGMSADFLPHAFETFSQEYQKGMSSRNQGTGLGLPIVREIVTKMGGKVSVASAPGAGTTFTVELPLEIIPEPKDSEGEAGGADISGLRVLLCEDNAINREIAVKLLEKRGCIVDCAENGKAGLRMFTQSDVGYYNVILIDIRMPVMNGIDATQAIRESERADAESVAIIAMTADAFTEDARATQDAGMNAHLPKPINPKVLFELIHKYGKQNK